MSIRNAIEPRRQKEHNRVCPGNIFGESIDTDYWSPLAITPPSSPSPIDGAYVINGYSNVACSGGFSPREVKTNLVHLSSAIQTFSYSEEDFASCAVVIFEMPEEHVVISASIYGTRLNKNPVIPRLIHSDRVAWMLITNDNGEEGNAYVLSDGGNQKAVFEVYKDRIVFVTHEYDRLSYESGLLDQCNRLVFYSNHLERLRALRKEIVDDDMLMYLPVSEILIGRSLMRIPLTTQNFHCCEEARRIWNQVKKQFVEMHSEIITGIDDHNEREFVRACVKKEEYLRRVPLSSYFQC